VLRVNGRERERVKGPVDNNNYYTRRSFANAVLRRGRGLGDAEREGRGEAGEG